MIMDHVWIWDGRQKMKNENECTRCGEFLTKTYAPFRNFSHCEVCEPDVKNQIQEYMKTIPKVGGGSGKMKGDL